MKKIFLISVFSCVFCSIKSQVSSSYEWTWIGGSSSPNQFGHYGQKGVESAGNMPGARYGASKWVDKNDNLWLFGGSGYADSGSGALNDLWKFNTKTKSWTWMSGDSIPNSNGKHGILGGISTSDPTITPSGRHQCSFDLYDGTLLGLGQELILFGGGANYPDNWNDVWIYSIDKNQWRWVSGDNTINGIGEIANGNFSIGNKPVSRGGAAGWVAGNVFCIYGGQSGPSNILDDFWEFDITGQLGGGWKVEYWNDPNLIEISQYVAGKPGNRLNAVAFYDDVAKKSYLFGGWGYAGSSSAFNSINDLWKTNGTYEPVNGFEWQWIKGDTTVSSLGSYGSLGVSSPTNNPPARWISTVSKDIDGSFVLFGGYSGQQNFNDVWSYNISSNIWTWVGGGNGGDLLAIMEF